LTEGITTYNSTLYTAYTHSYELKWPVSYRIRHSVRKMATLNDFVTSVWYYFIFIVIQHWNSSFSRRKQINSVIVITITK